MRLPAQGASKQTVENYENSFREVVELCEEYWYILRIESSLFCTLPMSMFGKTESAVVEPLTWAFWYIIKITRNKRRIYNIWPTISTTHF